MRNHTPLALSIGPQQLPAELTVLPGAERLVVFVHGSGSGRFSPRNVQVAQTLQRRGFGTLLFDLLTADEAGRQGVFDVELLAERVLQALDALRGTGNALPVGLFGASTGAAAALMAAARRPREVQAVVSRGGRPDLATGALGDVRAPTLLIVGAADVEVLALNREALARLRCEKRLDLVPRATHLFEEAGAMEAVVRLAGDWFESHLKPAAR